MVTAGAYVMSDFPGGVSFWWKVEPVLAVISCLPSLRGASFYSESNIYPDPNIQTWGPAVMAWRCACQSYLGTVSRETSM